MCEPLNDLALDFESEILQNALDTIKESVHKIDEYELQKMFVHGPLAEIVESNIDQMDDLLNSKQKQNEFEAQKVSMSVSQNENEIMEMKFPELIFDAKDGGNNQNDENEF